MGRPHLLAATVVLLLPLDLRQAVVYPTAGHVLLVAAYLAVLVMLVLLRGWVPGRRPGVRATRPDGPPGRAVRERPPLLGVVKQPGEASVACRHRLAVGRHGRRHRAERQRQLMAPIDRRLDAVPPRLRKRRGPQVNHDRDRKVLANVEIHCPRRLEASLDARNVLPVRPQYLQFELVRPGEFHLVQLDEERDGAVEWSRVVGAPDTGDTAADHKQEPFADGREVAQQARGDLHG